MLAFPRNSAPSEGSGRAHWRLLSGGIVVLTLLLVATWYAGRESAGLEEQRLNSEVNRLAQKLASTQLALDQQRAKTAQQDKALRSAGKTAEITLESQLRRQLLKAQADANQYKAIVGREQRTATDNTRLLDALSSPGARLITLKGTETGSKCTAYAVVVENSRLVLVASNLPQLPEGHQFQIWIVRKEEPKTVSAGAFTADGNKRVVVSFENPSVMSDVSFIEVTDEPQGGSSAPSGAEILEGGKRVVEPS